MKADNLSLLTLLTSNHQYTIPIYQRRYGWNIDQCQQLWDDITRIANDKNAPSHFIGSIVYIVKSDSPTFRSASVIDGQQRLTTISLLIAALRNILMRKGATLHVAKDGEKEEITPKKLGYYLFNSDESGDREYKLLLTQGDKEGFVALVKDQPPPKDMPQHIRVNYEFFRTHIETWGNDLEGLYQALERLLAVVIILKQGQDNPQLIFESLNSTGLDLSQTDLIRNFLLMDLETKEQTRLYEKYWYPMEQRFDHENSAQFDRFMRDYLTLKSKSKHIPNIERVYLDFKIYAHERRNDGDSTEQILTDIARYAGYFVNLAREEEPNPAILSAITDLNQFKVEVAYPFLLEAYGDYNTGQLSASDYVAVIRLIESYVFRRFICGIPTNALNKIFPTLSKELNKSDYLKSLQLALMRKESNQRFPRNAEFHPALLERDIYSSGSRCKYLLARIERYKNKEQFNLDSTTIEHIMPQDPSNDWQKELGPSWKAVYERYLHTIGNLALTFYNSEMGNKSFIEKRNGDKGFTASGLWLNRDLRELDHWNETEILKRANRLADVAIQVWAQPDIPPDLIDNPDKKRRRTKPSSSNDGRQPVAKAAASASVGSNDTSHSLDEDLTGTRPISFSYGDYRVSELKKWNVLYQRVCGWLLDKDAATFNALPKSEMFLRKGVNRYFSDAQGRLYKPVSIGEIYVDINWSVSDTLRIIKKLLAEFGLDVNLFKIYLL